MSMGYSMQLGLKKLSGRLMGVYSWASKGQKTNAGYQVILSMQLRTQEISRRELLRTLGNGFGMLGLAHLLGHTSQAVGPLDVKPTHFPPRAKHVIFLFLNGGPSHVDTFDHKPMLAKYNGKPYPAGYRKTDYPPLRRIGNLMRSPFKFKKYGESGIEVSEIFPKLGECIDEVCVIKSMYTDQSGHASVIVYDELRPDTAGTSLDGCLVDLWAGY